MTPTAYQESVHVSLLPERIKLSRAEGVVMVASPEGDLMADLPAPLSDHLDLVRGLVADHSTVNMAVVFQRGEAEELFALFPEVRSLVEADEVALTFTPDRYLLNYTLDRAEDAELVEAITYGIDTLAEQLMTQNIHVELTEDGDGRHLSFFAPRNGVGSFTRNSLHVSHG